MFPHPSLDRNVTNSLATAAETAQALCQRVERLLCGNGVLALRGVTCELHQGRLTLCGQVPTYYLKQLAQVVASQVEGVEGLVNAIDVGSFCVSRRGP
jgi:osmotically-inducible protein OsmY